MGRLLDLRLRSTSRRSFWSNLPAKKTKYRALDLKVPPTKCQHVFSTLYKRSRLTAANKKSKFVVLKSCPNPDLSKSILSKVTRFSCLEMRDQVSTRPRLRCATTLSTFHSIRIRQPPLMWRSLEVSYFSTLQHGLVTKKQVEKAKSMMWDFTNKVLCPGF